MTVIKIRCNGKEKHVNEIDLDTLLADEMITEFFKGTNQIDWDNIPSRIVLDCKFCDTGKVIITRKIILDTRDKEEQDEKAGR